MNIRILVLFILIPLSYFFGCGNGNVGLHGTVVFSDDGSPLGVGTVCFETSTFCARGRLQPDGTFSVGSQGLADGLPPGSYRVFIAGAAREISPEQFESLIDEKYGDGSTTDWVCDVPRPGNRFDIKVDRFTSSKNRKTK